MNSRDTGTVTRPGQPDHMDAGLVVGGQPRSTDPWLRVDGHDASGVPAVGQPGHGRTASLRRQPVRIVEGRMKGGYTDVFELICGECGDHPYLDYREIPPRLQLIRGPYPLEAGLRAYAEHLGQASGQHGPTVPEADSAGPLTIDAG